MRLFKTRPCEKVAQHSEGRVTKGGWIIFLFACCLFLTACPPNGGDLVALAKRDGAELVTDKFKDDTLRVTHEGVTMRAHGVWSVADGDTSVILDISNTNAQNVALDFNHAELVNNETGTRLSLRAAIDENARGVFLSDKIVEIAGGQGRKFTLDFKFDAADGSAGVTRNVLGQTATLNLPVEIKSEMQARLDFVFDFKYAEHQR